MRFDAKSGPLYWPFSVLWIGSVGLYAGILAAIASYFYPRVIAAQEAGIAIPPPSQFDIAFILLIFLVAGLAFALISAWYQARMINHFARHTAYEQVQFNANVSAFGLIWLTLSNFVILLLGALLLAGVVVAAAAPFVDLSNLRAPEGVAVTQALLGALPFALVLGFTLFSPITQARTTGYVVRNMSLSGTAPLGEIAQSSGANVRYGEGLAEAFDIDAF